MSTTDVTYHDPDRDRWLVRLARAGYATRGVVYVLVGVLALMAAFGGRGDTEGTQGALASVLSRPGGQALLLLIALGLFCFALWRLCQAIYDADDHGKDAKGMAIRFGFVIGALTSIALGIFALSLAFGNAPASGASDANASEQGWTAWLMAKPFGRWLVGILGAVIIGVGLAQFVRAAKEKFVRRLDMPHEVARKVIPVCKAGFIARGIVYLIIGGFLVVAAWRHDPSEARGLEGALETLRQQPYGPWLLGLVALGFIGFAVYNFIAARYRRIHPPRDLVPG